MSRRFNLRGQVAREDTISEGQRWCWERGLKENGPDNKVVVPELEDLLREETVVLDTLCDGRPYEMRVKTGSVYE